MDDYTQEALDYSLILSHDLMKLPTSRIGNTALINLFIRSSLKVPSITRLREYFTVHIRNKSALTEKPSKYKCREWIRFHNQLRFRPRYEDLVPFTQLQSRGIKDKRYVMYKILSYEVKNGINEPVRQGPGPRTVPVHAALYRLLSRKSKKPGFIFKN